MNVSRATRAQWTAGLQVAKFDLPVFAAPQHNVAAQQELVAVVARRSQLGQTTREVVQ
jgi:hypothetical protein